MAFVTQQRETRLYVGKSAVFYNQLHKYGDFVYRIYGTKMEYNMTCWSIVDRDSTVDMATRYGMEGPGIGFRWGRYFPHPSIPALGTTQPPIKWVPGLFSGGKRLGRGVDHPPPTSAEVKEKVELYLYSPSGTSWPVLG